MNHSELETWNRPASKSKDRLKPFFGNSPKAKVRKLWIHRNHSGSLLLEHDFELSCGCADFSACGECKLQLLTLSAVTSQSFVCLFFVSQAILAVNNHSRRQKTVFVGDNWTLLRFHRCCSTRKRDLRETRFRLAPSVWCLSLRC